MKSLGEQSAVLVGQDFGSWVGYYSLAMRPDLFTGLFMMCSPPSPRPAASPVEGFKNLPRDLVFYQEYFTRPGSAAEIMQDIRGYLTGVYYSTSGACTDAEQWRAQLWTQESAFAEHDGIRTIGSRGLMRDERQGSKPSPFDLQSRAGSAGL